MKQNNPIVIGIRSHVVALDPSTGVELWRTKLKSGQAVTTYVRDDRVYAGVSGELFCVARSSGEVLWHNKLRRLGYGLVAFAADPARKPPSDLVIGIKGHVLSIDVSSGEERWRTNLKKAFSSEFVTVALHGTETILAGNSGELFGVHRSLGTVLWNANLKGLGLGFVSLGGDAMAHAVAIAEARAAAAAAT